MHRLCRRFASEAHLPSYVKREPNGRPVFLPFGFGKRRSIISALETAQGAWRILQDTSTHYFMEREDGFRIWFPKHAVTVPDREGYIQIEQWWKDSNELPHYSEYLHGLRRIQPLPKLKMDGSLLSEIPDIDALTVEDPNKGCDLTREDGPSRNWTVCKLTVDQVLDFQSCPRKFYLEHVLRLPSRISSEECRQYAVEELFKAVMQCDLTKRPASDYLQVLAPVVWKKTRVLFHSFLRRDGFFDIHELRRVKHQALWAVQQTLAFATGRTVFPSVPLPSEIPNKEMLPLLFPSVSVAIDKETVVSDVVHALNLPRRNQKSVVQMYIAGHHNDAFAPSEVRSTARLKMQTFLLERGHGIIPDEVTSTLCGPRRTQYVDVERNEEESIREEFVNSVGKLKALLRKLPEDFSVQKETELKVGPVDGPECDIPLATSENESLFPARVSTQNCFTCKLRAFCHPHVSHFRTRKLLEDNHKWLYGTAVSSKVSASRSDTPIASVDVEPHLRMFRNFLLEHKGLRGKRLAEVRVGDEIGIVDANLKSHEVFDYVFADLADPYSLLINGAVPSISKLEAQAEEVSAYWKDHVSRVAPKSLEDENEVYDIQGLRYVELE
ncbi:putative mitochondrial protein [Andalucia godoyi]|uniref:Putative mitochondrial protein n=1 Tax=Andalucia godoyi TaxID=505711 RepID=A0A8K0AJ14_ANDGO|nr:putative mitochondrial protein [Andalucia godoyi]|eukprot:ANDGO_02797.mRNA.1 putative mitochondrial protein